jgi:hypothetical protein
MKKVVMDLEDFEKLVNYVIKKPVLFADVEEAVEIKGIIKRAQIGDVEIKEMNKPN